MWKDLADLYRQSWRYALACPVLFLIPVAAELTQHIAEYAQGFYASVATLRAQEHSMLRMSFGTVKVLSLFLTGYWMIRWLEWRDPGHTHGFDRRSLRTYWPVWLLQLILGLPTIWAPVVAPALVKPLLIVSLVHAVLGPLLSDWFRAAAIGARDGPIRSIRRIAPAFPWALAFTIAAVLPLMALHYALGFGAMKISGMTQVLTLGLDTLLVGYLGAVISGAPWSISQHARGRLILSDHAPSSSANSASAT